MKNIRKGLSLLLAAVLLISSVSTASFAFAEDLVYFERGILTDGENTAYYVLDKDNRYLYLTGDGENTGRSPDYASAEEGPFAGRKDIETIVIEEDVDRIGDYTFANITSATTLIIQSNIISDSSMSTKAMIGCTGLKTIQGNSTALSTDVLLQVVKGAINVASGNWLEVAKNVINIGKETVGGDGTLDNSIINAMVDDYIYNGNKIYLGEMEEITSGYEERQENPCYFDHAYHHGYHGVVTTQPTCTEDGVRTYTCEVCGDTYNQAVDATGHNFVSFVLYAPDCTKEGIRKSQCTNCDAVTYEPIAPLGHTPETVSGYPATCSITGLTDGEICSVCGEIITPQQTISSTPHSYEYVYDAENDSYTSVCTVCGDTVAYKFSDVSALISAVELGKAVNPDDYSAESYNEMYSAIEPYFDLNLFLGLKYPQEIVDSITADILTKIDSLVPYLVLNVATTSNGNVNCSINGENSNSAKNTVLFGTPVTLTANEVDGYTFKGWYDTQNKFYVCSSAEYSFILTANLSLRAVYTENAKSTLTFANISGQVIKQYTKTSDEWQTMTSLSSLLPEVPFTYSGTNGRWYFFTTTVISQLVGGQDVEIRPTYDLRENTMPEQPVSPDGKTPAINLIYNLDETTSTGSCIMAFEIPEGCNVVSIGMVFCTKKAETFDPTQYNLTITNKTSSCNYIMGKESGTYIVNLKNISSKYNRAVKGYITYYDEEENLKVAYSEQLNIVNRQQVN